MPYVIILNFIKKCAMNPYIWIIVLLGILLGVQSFRLFTKSTEATLLAGKVETLNAQIVQQRTEFVKLEAIAKEQDTRLQTAYANNIEIEKRHAKNVARILAKKPPAPNATCDEMAKWALGTVLGREE